MPQRGDIDYDLIRSAARQGLGAQFQMFAGTPPTTGHIAIYDVNGNVTDGGPPGTSYVLPPATASILGGVKIGANVSVAADGTISVAPPGSGGQNQTPWLSDINGAGYTLYSAGRIGVSVTSPQTQLEIAGGMLIDSTAGYTTPTTGTGIWMYCDNTGYSTIASRNFTGAVYTDLELDGQDLYMYALGAGAIGGTLLLDALGARAAINVQASDNAGGAASINFNVNGVSGAPGGSIRMNQQGTSISNSSTHTTPVYPLHVDGDCNVSGVYRVNGVPLSTGQNQTPWLSDIQAANYRLHHCAGIGIGVTSVNSAGVQVYGNFGETGFNHINTSSTSFAGFRADSDAVSVQLLANGTTESVLPSTASLITIGAYPLVLGANSAEAMRIGSNGMIGVHIGNPQYTIDVWGNVVASDYIQSNSLFMLNAVYNSSLGWVSRIAGSLSMQTVAGSSSVNVNVAPATGAVGSAVSFVNAMEFTGNGYIGIGMQPQVLLDVAGLLRLNPGQTGVPTSGPGVEMQYNTNGGFVYAYDRTAGHYTPMYLDGANLALNSQSGASVGVGTASPQTTLDVNGVIRTINSPSWPASGAGVEIGWVTGGPYGVLQSYDRGGGAFRQLSIQATPLILNAGPATPTWIGGYNTNLVGADVTGGGLVITGTGGTQIVMQHSSTNCMAINGSSDGSWQIYDCVGANWTQALSSHSGRITIGNNEMSLQSFMSGNWSLTAVDTNMYWNGSAYVPINSAYPGIHAAAGVLNNGTGDASWGVSYMPIASGSLRQLFAAQMYQNFAYCTLSAGGGGYIDSQLTYAGEWYTYAPNNTQLYFRMRGSDGVFRQAVLNLS